MKFRINTLTFGLGALSFFLSGNAIANSTPIEVATPVEHIYVPQGFDDNDSVELMLYGNFPSACYKVGDVSTKVDHERRLIMISATSLHYPEETCLQLVTPFLQSVRVGVLNAGRYEAKMSFDHEVPGGQFIVSTRRTESPDDFLYAPVSNAQVFFDPDHQKQFLEIQGQYPNTLIGCAIMEEVKTIQHGDGILIGLPIMNLVEGEPCNRRTNAYKIQVPLEKYFPGKGLLHVRVTNGQSINRIIYGDWSNNSN